MTKPGRNDLCYCGSGKKYKQCHLKLDQEVEQQKRLQEQAAQFLRQDLIEYGQDERWETAVSTALPHYWDNYYDDSNSDEMSDYEVDRFYDWFMFDYPIPADLLEDDEDDAEAEPITRFIQLYYVENYDDLSKPQQTVLESWLEAGAAGGYELVNYEGQTLQLRDFLTGEEVEVYEPTGRGQVSVGEIILARLVPVGQRLEFSTGAAYLPAGEIGDIGDKLAAAKAAYLADHPDASHADFMRLHNHLLVHHALAEAKRVGRPPVDRLDPNKGQILQKTVQRFSRKGR
jgi:hypothetical protein